MNVLWFDKRMDPKNRVSSRESVISIKKMVRKFTTDNNVSFLLLRSTVHASTGMKVLWILLVVVLPLAGFILWFLLGPKSASAR